MKQKKDKAQVAMELLMTYGWSLLVVSIMIGTLSYFGIFSPNNFMPDKCMMEPPFGCNNVAVMEDYIIISLQNQNPSTISINSLDFKVEEGMLDGVGNNGMCSFFNDSITLRPGDSINIKTNDRCIFELKGGKTALRPVIGYSIIGTNINKTSEGKILTS